MGLCFESGRHKLGRPNYGSSVYATPISLVSLNQLEPKMADDRVALLFTCRRPRIGRIATSGFGLLFCIVLGFVTETIAVDDAYIAGYAGAVLEHEFNVSGAILQVQKGVVIVTADSLGNVDKKKVIATLEKIPGVVRAEIQEGTTLPPVLPIPSEAAVQKELPKSESTFLPRGLLVAPFHADPRWPHFSIASRHLLYGPEPSHTGSANFGETFALYRNAAPFA